MCYMYILLGLASFGDDAVKTRLPLRELDSQGTIFLFLV